MYLKTRTKYNNAYLYLILPSKPCGVEEPNDPN